MSWDADGHDRREGGGRDAADAAAAAAQRYWERGPEGYEALKAANAAARAAQAQRDAERDAESARLVAAQAARQAAALATEITALAAAALAADGRPVAIPAFAGSDAGRAPIDPAAVEATVEAMGGMAVLTVTRFGAVIEAVLP